MVIVRVRRRPSDRGPSHDAGYVLHGSIPSVVPVRNDLLTVKIGLHTGKNTARLTEININKCVAHTL